MTELIVLAFRSEGGAKEALAVLSALQKQELISFQMPLPLCAKPMARSRSSKRWGWSAPAP